VVRIRVGRSAAAGAALVAAMAVAGCGAGQVAQTAEQVTENGGAEGRAGQMLVRNAQFTYDRPVPGGTVYEPGATAPLQVTIVNEGPDADRLLAVSSPIATSGLIVGEALVPGGQALTAGYNDPISSITTGSTEAIEIALVGLTSPISAGLTYPVDFTFERGGVARVEVPVENPEILPPRARVEVLPGEDHTLETGPEVEDAPAIEDGPR
jgi:copper(I)-binding protein